MKTRKRKPLSKKRPSNKLDYSSSSGDEKLDISRSIPRVTVLRLTNLEQYGERYDADCEPSSANDEQSSANESRDESFTSEHCVNNVLSDNESSDIKTAQVLQNSSSPGSSHSDGGKAEEQFKVPSMAERNRPINFYSSFKREHENDRPHKPLRVSFCDESFSDKERHDRKPLVERTVQNTKSGFTSMETSTPAHISSKSITDRRMLRVSLPRLSNIISPIISDDSIHQKRARGDTPKEERKQLLSSGYESMMISADSRTNGSYLEEDRSKRRSTKQPSYNQLSATDEKPFKKPTPKSPPKNSKKRRLMAIEKIKEKEQRYLDEIADLDGYELFVE